MSIENLKTFDPFAEADADTGEKSQSQQDYIHIRIQRTSCAFAFPLAVPFSLSLSPWKPHTAYRPIRFAWHPARGLQANTAQNAMAARP